MSMAGAVARSVYEDVRAAVLSPVNFAKEVRYTIKGLREGKIPPKWVAWTIVSTIGAVLLVGALMFPVYWVSTLALKPGDVALYSPGGAEIIPAALSIEKFAWVFGNIVTPSNIVVGAPLVDLSVAIPLPDFVSGITLFDATQYDVGRSVCPDGSNTIGSCFPLYLHNSMYVAVWTVIIGMAIVIPGAYGMSRRDFIGRKKLLYLYILLTQVGGGLGIAVLIALYVLFTGLNLYNNKLALAAYYAAGAVPFNTWLLKTYMDGIPTSYEEAAIVDGAPSWRVVYEIIIPLSKAGLATVLIFIFLAGWMDYIIASQLLDPGNYTLPVGLFSLTDGRSIEWGKLSAFALAFATPIMIVYLFAQRYIESGLSFGGMEG